MPLASDTSKPSPAKILIFGDIKTKKTWWALNAAVEGYNVTLLDGDNGHHIVAKQPEAARKKIAYINLSDEADEAHFHTYLARMYKNKSFGLNEHTRQGVSLINSKQLNPEHHHVIYDPTKLTSNDVLIVDSWSAFCRSMGRQFGITNDTNKIPSGMNKKGEKKDLGRKPWEDYGWGQDVMFKILDMLKSLPCHVVVIAHSVEKVVYAKDPQTGKQTEEIKSETMQPLGYSTAQGRMLGQFFTDILYTYVDKMDAFKISTKNKYDAVGGSRVLDPKVYAWSELTWKKLLEDSKGVYAKPEDTGPEYSSEAFQFLKPGELPASMQENKRRAEKLKETDGVNTITENTDGKRVKPSRLRSKNNVITSKI